MKGALTLVLLVALAGCGSSQRNHPGPEADHGVFVPATHYEAGRAVLPIVFPDGTKAELVYPPRLDIAGLGVRPYSSASLQGKSHVDGRSDVVGRDFWIFHGDLEDVLVSVNEGTPPRLLAEYAGVQSQTVGFWDLAADGFPHLGFQFGRWAVLVYDYPSDGAMTDAERTSWAASFSGHETGDGFLLLEGSGPLRLARAGEHAGPELEFGNVPDGLSLFPGRCTPHRDMDEVVAGRRVDRSPGFAHWCLSPWMRAHAGGSESFITALLRDLEVRNVRLADPRAE